MVKKSEKNNEIILILSILIVTIIIAASAYIVFYYESEEPIDEPETIKEIDDRISPDLNQGLLVEINRIRHRGLLDTILQMGSGWKTKPSFYYICTRDGNTFISKDESAAGGASNEQLFNSWDTMFEDNRLQEDIEEEQETCEVTLTIVERVNSGLLGLKSEDVERDKIEVTYDFRTGRWNGDDFLKDEDGYGHYIGDYFEVWFNIYQTDFDGDMIPYWTEVNIINTDPMIDDSIKDPDEDGIPTSWEWKWGYDPHTWDNHEILDPDIDGIQNIEEYMMRKYFANPFSQDIYIEADGMEKGGIFDPEHVFFEESGQIMIERFAQHGINLYIDNGWRGGPTNAGGEILPHYETISQETGVMLQFYRHNFPDERKGIFRYMIVGHNAGFCIPSELNRYDTLVIDSSPYKLYLRRSAFTPRTQRLVLAAAALHELAHSLGIAPWTFQGNDNLTFADGKQASQHFENTWGDYYSVNNYYYIWDKKLVDYSDGRNGPPYDQNDWEHFYLPTFDIEANAIEDPIIEPPGTDRLVDEQPEPVYKGWIYNVNLSEQYMNEISKMCFVENVDSDLRIYVEDITEFENNNDDENKIKIRVYSKPDTGDTYSIWSLISEGVVDSNDVLHFYSLDELIDDVRSRI